MKNFLNHATFVWLPNQLSLKMKLSVFLIMILLTQAQAYYTHLYGQQDKITLQLKNATVGQFIDKIEDETEYKFVYNIKDVDKERTINLNTRDASIEELLREVFGNTTTEWSMKGTQILLTRKKADMQKDGNTESHTVSTLITPPAENEQETVTGTVSDAGGPMPGVVVSVKGKNISTITDDFGYFSIEANPGDILVFSYPGYDIMEAAVGTRASFAIELQESVTELENAVINAGYYTVRDRERTGSISRITAKDIENQPVNTVLDAMQGKVTGLDIIQTTGLAGSGYKVRIRGQNSIAAGNEPLYIVDGVPYDAATLGSQSLSGTILPSGNISPLNSLDPSAIESVEILKDADATAIYGSRGANGVILITTKKGKSGKTVFTADVATTLISVTKMKDLLNTEQYLQMRQEAYANDGITVYPSTAYDINGTWDQSRYTDWQKEFIGNTAYNHSAKLNVSGGSEQTRFTLGGNFMKETTVFPFDFNYKRTTAYTNVSHESRNKRFQIQFSANYGLDNNYLPASDLTSRSLTLSPNAPALYNGDGSLNWEDSTWDNPYAELESTYRNKSRNLIANSVLSYKLLKSWTLKTNFGYTNFDMNETQANPSTRFNPAWGATSASSSYFVNDSERNSWIIEPQIDGTFSVGNGKFNLTIGGTLQEQNFRQVAYYGYGYDSDALLNNISAAKEIYFLNNVQNQYRYVAGYARLNYNLSGKYIINLTGRRDGSSRFGPGKQFANFGAVGAAWIFSKEKFLENLSWLNFGKLRASYGITGNDQIGDYQYLNTYTINDAFYDDNIGLGPTRLFNPLYAWEQNRKYETALEAGLFKDRINFEIAYYNNRSANQLVGIPLPATTGFSSINANLDAVVDNSGWEFSLRSTNIKSKNFTWETTFNISLPKTELVEFEGLENSTYQSLLAIGYPLNIYKTYHFTGVNSETGIFEFEDYNGDGVISAVDDREFIVDLSPKLFGNIHNSFRYKNFGLEFSFQFVKKKGFNQFYGVTMAGLMANQPVGVLDHWQNPGDESQYQQFSATNYEAYVASSRFAQSSGVFSDASFIRLKNLALSYNLPMTGAPQCSLYLQGTNLFTITKFNGGDPEQGIGFLPPVRRISIGVKVQL